MLRTTTAQSYVASPLRVFSSPNSYGPPVVLFGISELLGIRNPEHIRRVFSALLSSSMSVILVAPVVYS